jgi:hypothetical protein
LYSTVQQYIIFVLDDKNTPLLPVKAQATSLSVQDNHLIGNNEQQQQEGEGKQATTSRWSNRQSNQRVAGQIVESLVKSSNHDPSNRPIVASPGKSSTCLSNRRLAVQIVD